MKIYVSEKVIDSVDFSDNEKIEMMGTVDLGILDTSEADVNYAGAYEIFAEIPKGTIVKSLEQHDAEMRKPLEDEIERLKSELSQLKEIDDELLKDAASDIQLIDNWRNQERQKVIAELEEWASKELSVYTPRQTDYETPDQILFSHRKVFTDDLKQKLNEMKWV